MALAAVVLLSLLIVATPLPARICLLASLFAAGVQQVLALRVAFDELIFQKWAETWSRAARNSGSQGYMEELASFDDALATSGLRPHSDGVVRDLDSRERGALRLLKKQAASFVLQFATTASAAVFVSLLPKG
jgi:hypothetical protein